MRPGRHDVRHLYDSDDAMCQSLPAKAQEIMYQSDEPPPSFVTVHRVDQPPSKAKAKAKAQNAQLTPDRPRKPYRPETQIPTRHGDSVLMSYLGPDCPDVAVHARNFPYTDWSPGQGRLPQDWPPATWKPAPLPSSMGADEGTAGRKDIGSGGNRRWAAARAGVGVGGDMRQQRVEETVFESESVSQRHLPRVQLVTTIPRVHRPSKDLLKQSPELGHRVALPSLQSLSLPPSRGGHTPDLGSYKPKTKTLPSIRYALGRFSSRLNGVPLLCPYSSCPESATSTVCAHDRQLRRHFLPSHIPPSLFSQHLFPVNSKEPPRTPFPASPPSSAFWRGLCSPSPPPPQPTADTPQHVPTTPYDMSLKSPAADRPTPTYQISSTLESSERASFNSTALIIGPRATGSCKCTHPGCTAPPFKTEYLLKSHANVHSQDRLYFCAVEGCPRGLDGKGFKRKNEMMRHGLVHNSPGYVCPFCPDQQHQYPRPDNLLRHVRARHVDKSKDDPILRHVLAQRPVGSTRGQRRRVNSG